MPIPADQDFCPIFRQWLWHWGKVDAALEPGAPLLLHGSLAQAEAAATYAAHEAEEALWELAELELRLHRAAEAKFKRRLNGRLKILRRVLGLTPLGRLLRRSVPAAPSCLAALETFGFAARRAAWAWGRLEAALGPVVLRDGTTRADLLAGAESCESLAAAQTALELELALLHTGLAQRRERASAWLPVYRATVPGLLRPGHPLVARLPRWCLREKPRRRVVEAGLSPAEPPA